MAQSKAYWRAYRLANAERIREKKRAYYMSHREQILASQRIYLALPGNRARKAASNRRYNDDGRRDEYYKTYYNAHRDEYRIRSHNYFVLNPDRRTHIHAARRARQRGNGGSHTLQEWKDKCALLGNVCIYCGEAKPLTRDHKVPLSRGGTDDIANIVPACRSCNCSKGTKTAQEFLALKESA